MAWLAREAAQPSVLYRDAQTYSGANANEKYITDLTKSSTLYIGNLSFYTSEEQVYEMFSKCGTINRVIMGLDKIKKTPCGFCFVEYYLRSDAERAMRFINWTKLDDRVIRVDWDAGFQEGRQFGRGKSGGQVRDEYRTDYDQGRGGFGGIVLKEMLRQGDGKVLDINIAPADALTPGASMDNDGDINDSRRKRKREKDDGVDDDVDDRVDDVVDDALKEALNDDGNYDGDDDNAPVKRRHIESRSNDDDEQRKLLHKNDVVDGDED